MIKSDCKVIYITGSPCSGKTTIANALSGYFETILISTDVAKHTLRYIAKSRPKNIIHANTFSAYQNYTTYSPDNLMHYAEEHSKVILKPIKSMIEYFSQVYPYVIVEGAHLIPKLLVEQHMLNDNSYCFFLNVPKHILKDRIFGRGINEKTHSAAVSEITVLQNLLDQQARHTPKTYCVTNTNKQYAINKILRIIKNA